MAIHVLLNEVGAPFKLEKAVLAEGATRTPEYLKLNPRGQVPVLVEDDKVMREGAAMLVYLAEKFKSPLLPAEGWGHAQALQWLMFCNSSLHPAYGRVFWLLKAAKDMAEQKALIGKSCTVLNAMWAEIEEHLQTRSYLCGEQCTLGDIVLTVIANWSGSIPEHLTIGPKTRALFSRVIARPSYQKALTTEQVEYKMAA
jgi:glutathione S-transferase